MRRPNTPHLSPSLIPWQTPLSCTLYFIHILMGLATTLVHGRLWGGVRRAPAFTLQPWLAEEAPEASLSPLSLHASLSPSSSLPLHAPKGFVR